jgi:hypothetical protein
LRKIIVSTILASKQACFKKVRSKDADVLELLAIFLLIEPVKFILSIIHSKFQEIPRYKNSNSRKVLEKYHN